MARIKHAFHANGAARKVTDTDWDDDHVIELATGKILIGGPDGVAVEADPATGGTVSLAWADITGKPTTFVPSAHTHVISDVTGLQGALDGKQPVGSYLTSINSGNVTTALGYTPTSITGLTGVQTASAVKTGLALVKADVGLGSVDNTSDATKNVLSATKLTTARTINGTSFDGSANITINAVDSTARQPLDADLTAIAALAGTTGLLRKTAADTWSLDTATYLTGITSGNVTTALGYTPTSVTGLTGIVSVATFKTGLGLVKADVGLANVDNIADSAKNVLSATKLTTARTINGQSFDGSANITINAVDSTARLASSAVSTFMLTVLDDIDAATARATLGAQVAGTYATGTGSASGTNTGDETYTTITTKLAGGSGGGTTNFLRADGTFAAPPAGGGGVTSVGGTAPIVSSGGTTPAISITAATTVAAGSMSAADKTKLDGIATGATANTGTVTAVSVATANSLSGTSSGGATPALTLDIAAATTSVKGAMSAADKTKLDGITAGAIPNPNLVSSLAADVQLPTTNAWVNGPSVTCTTGTWLLIGQATIERTTATAAHYAIRFAGSGTYGSTQGWNTNVAHTMNLAAFGVVTVAGASEVVTLQGLTSVGATTALMKAAIPQAAVGNNATRIIAIKIA